MDSLESDMQLLLESLQYLNDDKEQQIQALKTLANMCNEKVGASYMYKRGGLKTITNIFCNTQSSDIKQWALYGLSNSVQYYVPSKKLLCIPDMMKKIHAILTTQKTNYLVHVAANFVLSLASDYAPAQELARTENCLHRLLEIYRSSLPRSDIWFDGVGKSSNELWMIVSSALCILMSDPQNEKNQALCTNVLPQAISMLKNSRTDVIFTALNFIGHCISNNRKTQRTLQLVGGLHALVNLLKKYSDSDGDREATLLSTVLKTISYAVTDFLDNKKAVGSLSIVSVLLDLLQKQSVFPCVLSSCLICLSRCIDDCVSNRAMLFKNNGVKTLISILISAEDEEVRRIVLFLLRGCLPLSEGKMELSDKDLLSRVLGSENDQFEAKNVAKDQTSMSNKLPLNVSERASDGNPVPFRNNLRTPSQRAKRSEEGHEWRQIPTQNVNAKQNFTDEKLGHSVDVSIQQLMLQNKRLIDVLYLEKGISENVNNQGISAAQCKTSDDDSGLHINNSRMTSHESKFQNQSMNQCEDDKIMKMLGQQEKLLQSVNKRIDDLKFVNDSRGRQSETNAVLCNVIPSPANSSIYVVRPPTSSDKVLCKERNSISNSTADKYDDCYAIASPNVSNYMEMFVDEGTAGNTAEIGQPTDQLAYSNASKDQDAIFKVPSRNNGVLSGRRTSKKCYDRGPSDRTMCRSRSISDMNVEAKNGEFVRSTSTIRRNNAFATKENSIEHNTSSKEASRRDQENSLQNTPSRSLSIEDCGQKRPTARYTGKSSSTKRNLVSVLRNVIHMPNPNAVDQPFFNDTLRVTITPGVKRKVQNLRNNGDQPSSTLPKKISMPDKIGILAESTGSASNRMKTRSYTKQTASKSFIPTSSTQAFANKNIVKLCDDSNHDQTSEWVNATNSKYDLETNSVDIESMAIESARANSNTPLPLNPPRNAILSSSTGQHVKTPSDRRSSRLSKIGQKVKRTLAFNGDTSPFTEDNDSPVSGRKGEFNTQSSRDSIARAASPTILKTGPSTGESSPTVKASSGENNKCLGCYPFARFPFFVVNSRNFTSALQNDEHTCQFHVNLIRDNGAKANDDVNVREKVHKYLESCNGSVRKSMRNFPVNNDGVNELKGTSAFDYLSEADKNDDITDVSSLTGSAYKSPSTVVSKRRKRKDYTDEEIENILEGVDRHGKRWNAILYCYKFKLGRTASDLKDKYRQICKKSSSRNKRSNAAKTVVDAMPFTAQEMVNLKTGFGRYGGRWQTILNNFKFRKGRSAVELERKYERVLKRF